MQATPSSPQVPPSGRSAPAINELRGSLGEPHDLAVLDVARDGDVKAWSESVLNRFGPPDLLINNASDLGPEASLEESPRRLAGTESLQLGFFLDR